CVTEKKSYLCDLPAYGFGGTTRRALQEPTFLEALANQDPREPIPSNGSLMRTVPAALRFRGFSEEDIAMQTARCAQITHRNYDAVQATINYVLILDEILAGKSYRDAVNAVRYHQEIVCGSTESERLKIFDFPAIRPPVPKGFGGGAVYTLKVAHWAI